MSEHLKTEYGEMRREQFAKGFLELLMQMPYEKIVVRDLCEHWKISRKTFYRYFSCKEDALGALVDYVLLNIGIYIPPVSPHPDRPLLDEMIRYFYYWSENRQILKMLLDNSLMEILFFRSVSNALSEMDIFRKKLQHMESHERESVVAFFVGGVISMLLYWLRNDFSETPEQMAERLSRLVGNPGELLF